VSAESVLLLSLEVLLHGLAKAGVKLAGRLAGLLAFALHGVEQVNGGSLQGPRWSIPVRIKQGSGHSGELQ
jgi:hypothetical protein